jgi:hypothetical protein
MSRGVARMRTFLDDRDRRRFLDIVGRVVAALNMHVSMKELNRNKN